MNKSLADASTEAPPGACELKVAYILHRFPHLTETFIVREVHEVRHFGVHIEIFSLLSPRAGLVHEEARALLSFVHYSPYLSKEVLGAQLHFIKRSFQRYVYALHKAIRLSIREPGLLLRTLVVFPKSVYFARQMQETGIQHIHAHFAWLGGIAASIIAELLGVTYTVHAHAFDIFTRNNKAVQTLLEDASQIVTISQYHRAYIASICPRKRPDAIAVVHCGLDLESFKGTRKLAEGTACLILSVASLNEKKGHEYLIDACAHLAERGISFRCVIVGDGPHRRYQDLRARISGHRLQDRVTLLGPMTQQQIVELYHQSDIFALACVIARNGDRDGIPVVLMEAMACELPVITTAVAGIPELVQDGVTGLLVEQRDATSLANALEKLCSDKTLRVELGKRARYKVQTDFNIRQSASDLVSLFQQLDTRS